MKICMVSEDYEPGVAGVAVHLQTLVAALLARGHQVLVLTSRKPGQTPVFEAAGLTVHRFRSVNLSGFHHSVTTTGTLAGLLEAHRIDVVQVHFLSRMASQARRAAHRLGIPAIYTYHMAEEIFTSPVAWLPPLEAAVRRIIRRFCNRFDLVTFPSPRLMERVIAGGLTARHTLLGNAVAFPGEPAPATEPPAVADPFILLFVGRLSPEKNLALLLRAFRGVVAAGRRAELHVVGAGPLRADLERLARELEIEPYVRFAGHVPHAEVRDHYLRAHAFVLASLFEVKPMVCVEAMQCGLPLLVSDGIVSGDEFVEEGRNGFIFDHRSEDALRNAVLRLANSDTLRRTMATESRTRATGFSLPVVVQKHEELYRAAVASFRG